jgi:hypothetical protein
MFNSDMNTVKEAVQFQFVANPHRQGEVCLGIHGMDTPEIPDAWTEGEVEALIEVLQQQLHEMVSKRNIQAIENSNLWSGSD